MTVLPLGVTKTRGGSIPKIEAKREQRWAAEKNKCKLSSSSPVVIDIERHVALDEHHVAPESIPSGREDSALPPVPLPRLRLLRRALHPPRTPHLLLGVLLLGVAATR